MIGFGLLWLALSGASPYETDSEALNAVRARIAQEKVRNHFLRNKEADAARRIAQLDASIRERTAQVQALTARIDGVRDRLRRAESRHAATSAELQALQARAGRRAAAMQKLRRVGIEAFLVGIEDPVRLRRTEDRFRFVLAHDRELVRSIRETQARRQVALDQVRAQEEALRVVLQRVAEEQAQMAAEWAERAAFVRALRAERVSSDRLAAILRRAASISHAEAGRTRGLGPPPAPREGGFAAQKGVLPWPAAGRVEVGFGAKVDPATGVVLRQTGIDLRAEAGALVRAPFAAEVAAVRRLAGFGLVVILDHGEGHHTVYGHLAETWVPAGRFVQSQQAVGTVGDTGSDKGAFLYFEIRKDGEPQDPLEWLTE